MVSFCINRWAKFYIDGIYSNLYNRLKITALVDRLSIAFVLLLNTAPLTLCLGQSLTLCECGITASYKLLLYCVVLYCCYSIQRQPIVLYCCYSIQRQPIVLYCCYSIQRQPIALYSCYSIHRQLIVLYCIVVIVYSANLLYCIVLLL